jgi:hypothetical protein
MRRKIILIIGAGVIIAYALFLLKLYIQSYFMFTIFMAVTKYIFTILTVISVVGFIVYLLMRSKTVVKK